MSSFADEKARLAAAWENAARHPTIRLAEPPPVEVPAGYALWIVGDEHPFSLVTLPMLDPAAPARAVERYRARILATATGRCPMCGRAALPSRDPQYGRAGYHLTQVTLQVFHDVGCPAEFGEDDRHLFPIFQTPSDPVTPSSSGVGGASSSAVHGVDGGATPAGEGLLPGSGRGPLHEPHERTDDDA